MKDQTNYSEMPKSTPIVSITIEDIELFFTDYLEKQPTAHEINALCEAVKEGVGSYIYENMNEWIHDNWQCLELEDKRRAK